MIGRELFTYAVVLIKSTPRGNVEHQEQVQTYWSEDSAYGRSRDIGSVAEAVAHATAAMLNAVAKLKKRDESYSAVSASLVTTT